MAYDAARGVTVLVGGYNGVDLGDTWEWNGTIWTHRPTSGPTARYHHAMSGDSSRGVMVLFGGLSGVYLNDTWEYLSSPVLNQQPTSQATCEGGSATFSAAASGSGLTYQWRRGVTNLSDGGGLSGTLTVALAINPAALSDAASDYNLVITNAAGSITTNNVALTVFVTGSADANGDGVVDSQDVQPFADYLLGGGSPAPEYCAADMNGDGRVDGADIQPFVDSLILP